MLHTIERLKVQASWGFFREIPSEIFEEFRSLLLLQQNFDRKRTIPKRKFEIGVANSIFLRFGLFDNQDEVCAEIPN